MNTIKLNTIGEAPIKKGGASGGGSYVYYRGTMKDFQDYALLSSIAKMDFNGQTVFPPTAFSNIENIIAVGFDVSMKITNPENMTMITVGDFIAEASKGWTQITEEEFYRDSNALEDGYFRVLSEYENTNVILQYDDGMTWRDWINSHYNLNPTTSNPYIRIGYSSDVCWKYSDGYLGSIRNEHEPDSAVGIDDLITNETYYAVIIA